MRLTSVVFGGALCLFAPNYVRAEDEDDGGWDEEDDLTVTTDDFVDSDIEEPPAMQEDTSLAEKADEHLSQGERKMRMALCIGVAREKFLENQEEMEKMLEMMKAIHKMEADQAREMIHINMIKNCYINFNEKEDIPAITSGDKDEDKYKETVSRLVAPPTGDDDSLKQHTLLTRQWDLIKEVVEAERSRQSDLLGGDRIGLVGSKMGAFNKLLYFVSVFAVIFGGGYLLVKKLMQLEAEKNSKKTAKKKKSNRDSSVESVPQKKDQ
jgi:hypothetical protein